LRKKIGRGFKTLYVVFKQSLQGNLIDWNPPIRFLFCSMTVDPPLTSYLKYYVSTLNSFFCNTQFYFAALP
jgi:hypothetical protein